MMNDLPDYIKKYIAVLFVNDTVIIIGPIDMIDLIEVKLQADLNRVHDWMIKNYLKLNVSKPCYCWWPLHLNYHI
jgi:hypothetical protein